MSTDFRPACEPRRVLIALVLSWLCWAWHVPSSPAFAFQEGNSDGSMEPSSPAAAKPAAKPAAAEAPADARPPAKSFLTWLIDASGPFGACIFIESFIMVALIIMCFLQIRRQNFLPADFVEEFEAKLNARDYQGAFESAKRDESLIARLLVVGMTKLQKGLDAALKGMTELGEDENLALEHRLSWLALIATTGPMFGLLGTVQGMVSAFDVIAQSATQPKPAELAQGIMLALVTTLEGLMVAIPAMISYSLFRNQLTRLMFDVGVLGEQMISRFQLKPAAGGGSPAAAPANRES